MSDPVNKLPQETLDELEPEEIEGYEEVLAEEGENPDDPAPGAEEEAKAAAAEADAALEAANKEADKPEKDPEPDPEPKPEQKPEPDAAAKPEDTPSAEADPKPKEEAPHPEAADPAPQPAPAIDPVSAGPKPQFPQFDKPENAEEKLAEIAQSRKDLAVKFDDGEITAVDYNEQMEALNDQRYDIQRQMDRYEMSQQAAVQFTQDRKAGWEQACTDFMEQNKDTYPEDSFHYDMLNSQVQKLQRSTGDEYDPAHLEKAHQIVQSELAKLKTDKTDEDGNKDNNPKPDPRPDPPPTLGNVPSTDIEQTQDGLYSALDRLDGEDLEEKIAKMTPEQRERYLEAP